MTPGGDASIHASAVLVGDRGILIRGPSGSGKSRLAFDLILAGRAGQIPAVTLIGDDRVRLTAANGRLVVQGVPELAGMIEIRGLGIRTISHTAEASVAVVIDLDAADAERLPPLQALKTRVSGLEIPRIPVGRGYAALPLVLAFLTTV
ncbi:MAG: HPr kinase/phosphatase C-terminal domain-containing protein [Afipia sp.]|nr:HPr kinase/phosphatase C-terminal domain-containing protein [Afipia sp.]